MKSHSHILLLILAFTLSQTTTAQNIPSYVPTNGLVGWWPFNGNANDESGNGNNGTVNGALLTVDRFGTLDRAYEFDGVGSFIEVSDDSTLDLENQYTISAWVNIPDYTPNPSQQSSSGNTDDFRTIVGKPRTAAWTTGYNLTTYPNGQLTNFYTAIQNQSCCPDAWVLGRTVPQLNTWVNITCVYNGTTLTLYQNGVLDSSIQVVYTLDNSTEPLFIGKEFVSVSYNWYRWFKGKIDDIGIWNRALTQQEITNLYQGSVPTPCAGANLPANLSQGLVGWWPFCGNANDESGNGNNGTVNGPSLTADRFGNGNSAYVFNGMGDHILIANSMLNGQFQNYSISYWFNKLNSTAQAQMVITDRSSPNSGYKYASNFVYSAPGSGAQGCISNLNNTIESCVLTSDSNQSNGNWNQIVWTVDALSDSAKIYLNGILQSTAWIDSASWPNHSNPTFIGAALGVPSDEQYFNGKLDDIGIWNRALTPQEITQLYNTGICYQTITVTDTLIINANLTNLNPVTFQNTIKVYPNPANDHITIDCGSNFATMNGYSMRIDNSLGQTVYSTTINQQSFYVDLNTWSGNGVYFVYLINNNSQILEIRKIVIQ